MYKTIDALRLLKYILKLNFLQTRLNFGGNRVHTNITVRVVNKEHYLVDNQSSCLLCY